MIQKVYDKKYFLILEMVIAFLLICLVGASYAYLYTRVEGQKTYNITVKGYNLTIEEKNKEQTIQIENGEPVTDEIGKAGISYDFDLINHDTNETGYIIYLDDEKIDDEINRMKDIHVKYQLIENGVEKVGLVSELGTNPFRILTNGVIGGETTNHYSLRFWIKEGSEVFTSQIFSVKLRVIGTSKEAIESGELTPGDIIATTPNGVTQMTSEQLETYLNKAVEGKIESQMSAILEQKEVEILDKNHPIGSIYIALTNQNPGELFGGTWERYANGKTLVGIDEANEKFNTVEKTGGNTNGEVTLTVGQLPSHTHSFTPSGSVKSTFKGSSVTSDSKSITGSFGMSGNWAANAANFTGFTATGAFSVVNGAFQRVVLNEGTYNVAAALVSPVSIGLNDTHSHTVTAAGTVSSTFTGTTSTTQATGSGNSVSTQDPYMTVYIWKRVS